MIIQTAAIFRDAYRELNSKRMFWIVLSISAAVVIALGLPSNNATGIGIFGMNLDFPILSTKAVSPTGFYKFLLFWVGVTFWLTWGVTPLALISTASMIPDMVTSGSIDLVLSKPIGRPRLFLTKYLSGLMFVALQAAVFGVGAVLLIGIRAGTWDLKPLMTIPLVTLFFSYIYCMCALVGLVTRSTLAALLATIILWLGISAMTTVEHVLLDQRLQRQANVTRITAQLETVNRTLDMISTRLQSEPVGDAEADPADDPADASDSSTTDPLPGTDRRRGPPGARRLQNLLDTGQRLASTALNLHDPAVLRQRQAELLRQKGQLERELPERQESLANGIKWHRYFYASALILPKTGETKRLFQRYVVDKDDLEGFLKLLTEQSGDQNSRAMEDELDRRGLWWVLGTSLLFEGAVLGLACIIFSRRDF